MIVIPRTDRLRLITQNDHAAFAADLLKLWRSDGAPEHPRRRELLFATREHDNGWRETDSAPFCDRESGRPYSFTNLPAAEKIRIWHRGPRRFREGEPYASLLIAHHAQNIYRSYRGEAVWEESFADWKALEAELAEELGMDEDTVAADYYYLDITDVLSLAACGAFEELFDHRGVRCEPRHEAEMTTLAVDPFPLAGTTTFRIPCRLIPDRRYAGDTDLAVELASARWGEHVVRVMPA